MKLVVDEGVDKQIAYALKNARFDVNYILETHQGADDDFILQLAFDEKRILVTQDKDFGELVFRLQRVHYGVIRIRLHGYTPAAKAKIVTNFMLKYKDELLRSFTVIQPNAIRIRKVRL